MFKWLFYKKRREPIEHWASKHTLLSKYKNSNGDVVEISVEIDQYTPATFLIKSHGLIIGRFWVDEFHRVCVESHTSVKYEGQMHKVW
jgi:hypothetical protein